MFFVTFTTFDSSRDVTASVKMDLETLQHLVRKDPEGYVSEFQDQLRHFRATFSVFQLRPNEASKEFANQARFIAAVADLYPTHTGNFITEVMELLETSHEDLDKTLRKSLVQSLMQLRHRKCIELMKLLPLFFKLFNCRDKSLRSLLFHFIVSDLRSSTRGSRTQPLDRQMKGFLLNTLKDPNEGIAKKALAILAELWRREIWHEVHTANVIASALDHPKTPVMYAAVQFFLGYDLKEGEEDEEGIQKAGQLPTEDVYKAQKKGTRASKRRKQRQLKRVRNSLIKQARKESQQVKEQFSAIQLIQDPYKVAEGLFKRLRNDQLPPFKKSSILQLLSRLISVHQLVLLNFYPYLQKYMIPQNQEVLAILTALVQSCHEMVPPEVLEAPLKQLIDQFVHDHARPELITTGLKTVREMCARAPLIMNEDLLSDLILYKNFKNADVKSAAKGLISLFRELAPKLLPRKDRGRAGLLFQQDLPVFGQSNIQDRIQGAELLQKEKERDNSNSESSSLASSEDEVSDSGSSDPPELPLEMREILEEEDFERLEELKREKAVELQMKKYGLIPGQERNPKLLEAAEEDAEEMLRKQERQMQFSESGFDPAELLGKRKEKANKTERMLSILKGRENSAIHVSKAARKKRKTGGLSNKEKIKRKVLPPKARMAQAKKRRKTTALKRKGKNFKGHIK